MNINSKVNAFHKAEGNFFSMVSFTQVDYGNLVAFATGVQDPGLNPAIINEVNESLFNVLVSCQMFYVKKNLPWALVLPEYLRNEAVDDLLQQQAFVLTGKGVAMSALMEDIQFPSLSSPLSIREMSGNLGAWSVPLIHGFESTPEFTGTYTQRHLLASQSDALIYHFSGFINDTAVSSLTLSLCGSHARIDDVATIPAYQQKGYATELIYAALTYAKHLNINTCFLEASASGLNLYKRVGFNELFKNSYYEIQQIK